MGIFKKLISKFITKSKCDEDSCWYNNYSQSNDGCSCTIKNTDIKAPSSCELNCTRSISRR